MNRQTPAARRTQSERGVALVTTILAVVIIGALVTGVFTMVLVENRTAQASRYTERALAAAEHGLAETVAAWNSGTWNELAVLDSAIVAGTLPAGTGRYEGLVRRLNDKLFLVDITGLDGRTDTRQRIGGIVRVHTLDIEIEAALTTRGRTRVGGTSSISGVDQPPAAWGACPAPDDPLAGIRVPDAGDLNFIGGCSGASCVTGTPKIDQDPTVDDSTFFSFGDLDWATLTSMANKQLPPGNYQNLGPSLTADSACNTSDARNWGDPLNPSDPCGNYFPLIYVAGDLTVNTGVGQGVLLVEGDLSIQGGFEFYGIVISRGELSAAGTGNKINGAVMAANVDLDRNSVQGTADINYSSCAVRRAQIAAAPGAPLRSRGWHWRY